MDLAWYIVERKIIRLAQWPEGFRLVHILYRKLPDDFSQVQFYNYEVGYLPNGFMVTYLMDLASYIV